MTPALSTADFALAGLPAAGWEPAERPRLLPMLGVLVLHALAAFLLVQGSRLLQRPVEKTPVQVSLLSEPLPPVPAPRPIPHQEAPPLPQVLRVPVPEIQLPSREATAQPLAPPPAPPAAAVPAPPSVQPTSLAAPSPPAPKPISASALRWRVEPAVEVPRLSRRAGESGRVLLRVVFDTDGRPRDVLLQKSSGFPRLDAQALEAIRVARISPFLEDGRPIEVVATAVLDYELE